MAWKDLSYRGKGAILGPVIGLIYVIGIVLLVFVLPEKLFDIYMIPAKIGAALFMPLSTRITELVLLLFDTNPSLLSVAIAIFMIPTIMLFLVFASLALAGVLVALMVEKVKAFKKNRDPSNNRH